MLLVDTRDHRPEPPAHGAPLELDLPELRPWRWFAACAIGLLAAKLIPGALGLLPLLIGFACAMRGATAYYRGNDGLRAHRQ